ncbi:MAG: NAD(P)H-dependent oxidoreductase [Bacteriovoracaceae bacterium]|jgi:NAD(P)H-dependent FMN reductase|nr:NAD(P)H-dependent oxidoreductase [Bacteriovoracaceae bacterium]
MKLLVISATSGKNLDLANLIGDLAKKMSHHVEIIDLVSLNLPLYSEQEESRGISQNAFVLKDKIINANAVIFLAAEYNGLIPPSLNNAIAWISRTAENWREAFNGKVGAIGTHSGSGGVRALEAMRGQLSYIGMNILGRCIHTHFQKAASVKTIESVIKQLEKLS